MSKPKVTVTRRWPESVEAAISEKYDALFNKEDKPLTSDQLRDAIANSDAVLPTVTDPINANILKNTSPKAKILANYGVGFSHIDVQAANEVGIKVTNTPDVLSDCTADLAMTLLLMSARRVFEGAQEVNSNTWAGWRPTHLQGTKINGATLGIVGFGRIGQAMARRAHHGFGMNILVYDKFQSSPEVLNEYGAVQVENIDDLLPQCDFVSLHCPGGQENKNLINARRLSLMKETAYLINTARGEIIDEKALVDALEFETIRGAALDVYNGEPKIMPELRSCRNAILMPHLGSATTATREAMGFRVLENLNQFFEGKQPRDLVSKSSI